MIAIILLLLLLLLIMAQKKRTCKKIKGRKVCAKKPSMSARDIVKLQMDALQNNDKNDSGIQKAYDYASEANKEKTGPYSEFRKMVRNDVYKHLINCKRWRFVHRSVRKKKDEEYSVDVEVESKDNNFYTYIFTLTRQSPTLFWRTDSVILADLRVEGYTNSSSEYAVPFEGYTNSSDDMNDKLTCALPGPSSTLSREEKAKNVLGEELQICGTDPMTGWTRDGYCKTDKNDKGTHTVCAEVNDEFLEFTKQRGNDLSTKRGSFPGLKSGNKWCLCALRWKEAFDEGEAPLVKMDATNSATLKYVKLDNLKDNKLSED